MCNPQPGRIAALTALCSLMLASVVSCCDGTLKGAVAASPSPTVTSNPQELELVNRINADRKAHGVPPLTIEPILIMVARAHSREMCDKNYFDHHSPTPGLASPMDRYTSYMSSVGRSMPSFAIVGENIFYSSVFNDTYNTAYAHAQLMASPHHRKNILDPRFTKVGVGTYQDSQGEFWVTEFFLRDVPPASDLAEGGNGN